jgi:hypothetical protein
MPSRKIASGTTIKLKLEQDRPTASPCPEAQKRPVMGETPRIFPHRLNSSGDFESVCPDCLTTISSQPSEADLRSAEKNHFCDPVLLNLLWRRKRLFTRAKQYRRQLHTFAEKLSGMHRFHPLGMRFKSDTPTMRLALFSGCGSTDLASVVE